MVEVESYDDYNEEAKQLHHEGQALKGFFPQAIWNTVLDVGKYKDSYSWPFFLRKYSSLDLVVPAYKFLVPKEESKNLTAAQRERILDKIYQCQSNFFKKCEYQGFIENSWQEPLNSIRGKVLKSQHGT